LSQEDEKGKGGRRYADVSRQEGEERGRKNCGGFKKKKGAGRGKGGEKKDGRFRRIVGVVGKEKMSNLLPVCAKQPPGKGEGSEAPRSERQEGKKGGVGGKTLADAMGDGRKFFARRGGRTGGFL